MKPKSNVLADIQVLRAFACGLVLLQHLSLTRTVMDLAPIKLSMPFYLGVELFFVISGFVVTRSVFKHKPDAIAFLIRRFFRLTPPIVFYLAFCILVFMFVSTLKGVTTVEVLAMNDPSRMLWEAGAILSGVFINLGGQTRYYYGAMWSLSVEYQFYFAFAVVIGVLSLARLTKDAMATVVLVLTTTLGGLVLLSRVAASEVLDGHLHSWFLYLRYWRFDFLILGVTLALIFKRYGALPLFRMQASGWIAVALVLFTLGIGLVAEDPLSASHPILDHVLMPVSAIAFTYVVGAAACGALTPKTPGRLMRLHALMAWFGDRSFAMYLFHFPVMALVWYVITSYSPSVFYYNPLVYGALQAGAVLPITGLLAEITYRYVEVPWSRYGEEVTRRLSGSTVRPAPQHASS